VSDLRGVLGANRCTHAQVAHDAQRRDGDVRTARPVTQVFSECFFTSVDDGAERDLRQRVLSLNRLG
jgi:hypothetical protein